MIPIPLNTRNLKWMNSQKSRSSSMNGTGSSFFLTLNNTTTWRLSRFLAVRNVIFLKTAPALPVVPHNPIFTAITVKLNSWNAKSAIPTFHPMKTALPKATLCVVLTAARPLRLKRNGNTSSYINSVCRILFIPRHHAGTDHRHIIFYHFTFSPFTLPLLFCLQYGYRSTNFRAKIVNGNLRLTRLEAVRSYVLQYKENSDKKICS